VTETERGKGRETRPDLDLIVEAALLLLHVVKMSRALSKSAIAIDQGAANKENKENKEKEKETTETTEKSSPSNPNRSPPLPPLPPPATAEKGNENEKERGREQIRI
jgi:hypothetical protein